MSENEEETPLLLQSAAHGTAAMIISTHILIALIEKGILTTSEKDELLGASRVFAEQLGGPPRYVDLVLQTLDLVARILPAKSGGLH